MLHGSPRAVESEIPRPHVSALLDTECALTTVVAERGAGKTVAVAAWARRLSVPGAWTTVDRVDSDRRLFWERVFGLIEDATRDTATPVEALSLSDDLRRTLAAWAAGISKRTVLVVDGCERLDPVALDDLLWVSTLVSGLHIVLIGRRIPGAEEPLSSVRRLTRDDLLFSDAEANAVLEPLGARFSDEGASFVVHEVGGLPLAITAIARELAPHGATIGVGPMLRRVVELVAEQVVVGEALSLDSRQRDLLARVALLGHASAHEARVVMGVDLAEADAFLRSVVGSGLGSWSGAADSPVFELPPALARALARPLRSTATNAEILTRAVRLCEARGDVFEAVSLAIDARDFRLGVAIGAESFVELIGRHRDALLAQLTAVPRSELSASPLAVLFLAILHAQRPRGRVAMLAHYAWADQLARMSSGASHSADRAVLLIVRSTALRLLGNERWAASLARSAVEKLDMSSRDEVESLGILRLVILGQAAVAALVSGDLDLARDLVGREATIDSAPDKSREHAWARLAFIEAVRGDLAATRDAVAATRDLERWNDDFFRIPTALAEAMVAVEEMDHSAARRLLDEAAGHVMRTEFWPAYAAVAFSLGMWDGWPGRTAERLAAALSDRDAAPLTRTSRASLEVLLTLAHIGAGDLGRARVAARGLRRGSAGASIATAALRLALDDADGAVAAASDGIRADAPGIRVPASLRLLRAAAASRAGHRAAALRDVDVALDLLERSGLRTPWAIIPARDRAVLGALAAEVPDVSRTLLEDLARVPVVFPDVPAIAPLTARESDVLEGVIGGGTNASIAQRLGVSVNTVRKQRASAYRKLGVSTREAAVAVALERGLLDHGDPS